MFRGGVIVKTKAVRLHGRNDIRLEEFELPEIRDDQILARIVSDSVCMSSHKAALQGTDHKRVPKDISEHPVVLGHEFCGVLVKVGRKYADRFPEGRRFTVQPALNWAGGPVGIHSAPGYSYEFFGGDATYVVIPPEVMERDCLLLHEGDSFFSGSLAEPLSCIIGAFHSNYHTEPETRAVTFGIRQAGATAILAGAGPMGLAAIDYALHRKTRPGLLVVTDMDAGRLERAASFFPETEARRCGVDLRFVDVSRMPDPVAGIRAMTSGKGFDDVFVFAPVPALIEQADAILGHDGCLNFFAGPTKTDFKASINFYNLHYNATHMLGTSGGNKDDLVEALGMIRGNELDPAVLVTHIGGLDSVPQTVLDLDRIPGGKKLIYTGIRLPLTAIADFPSLASGSALFAELGRITRTRNGLWCREAEEYLLANAPSI
jgi:threonine dehydrogenase-like Zn-dependent dehydrogenase